MGWLIGADVFLDELYSRRSCWFEGSVRSYKTALAYRIAHEIMKSNRGFRYIISNVEDVWSTPLDQIELRDDLFIDGIFIIDEGGEFINNENTRKALRSFMGKMNNIILMPSAEPPFGEDALQCTVFYNLLNIGIPVIWYKWSFRKSKIKDSGSFLWVGMSEIYGIFNSAETTLSDMGILDFLMDVRNKLAKKAPPRRYYYGSKNYGILKLDIEESRRIDQEDSAETVQEVHPG